MNRTQTLGVLWAGLALSPSALAQDTPGDPAPIGFGDVEACRHMATQRVVNAPVPGPAPDPSSLCLGARMDVAGRLSLDLPESGLSRRADLTRARWEVGLWGPGPVSGRVAFEHARSGGGTGYVGVAGEAMVPVLQVAEGRVDAHRIGLSAAAGLVDDLWTMTLQSHWGIRYVSRTLANDRDWMDRSDIGGWLSWTSPLGFATLTSSLTTGEGMFRRERNNGKDVAGLLTLRPFAFTPLDANTLEVSVYGRDGSLGVDSARNHRLGARVAFTHDYVAGAVDSLFGWGLAGDADLEPGGFSLWARTGPKVPAIGWARLDMTWDDRDDADSRTTTWQLGGGPLLPWGADAPAHPLHVVVGYRGATFAPNAAPVPGGPATAHSLFLQLGFVFAGGAGIDFGG